mgnify:CR=1 FL=1
MGPDTPNSSSTDVAGVSVAKRPEEDRFSIPAVVYLLDSDRDDAVSVTLRQHLPESLPADDLRFHTRYESVQWSLDGDAACFEVDLDPGEQLETVVGIDRSSSDALERFVGAETEVLLPDLPAADSSVQSSDQATEESSDEETEESFDEETEESFDEETDDGVAGEPTADSPPHTLPDRETIPLEPEANEADETADVRAARPGTDDLPDSIEAALEDIDTGVSAPDESTVAVDDSPQQDTEPGGASTGTGDFLRSAGHASSVGEDTGPPTGSSGRPTADPPGESAGSEAAGDAHPSEEEATPLEGLLQRTAGQESATDTAGETAAPAESDEPDLTDFVAAVQQGEVSDEELRVLREIFTAEVQGDARLEARIRHLQAEVADLKAYTAALEEFLDGYGSGETVVDRLDDQLEDVSTELDAMAETVEAHDDDLAALDQRLDRLDRRHRELADAFGGLRDALEDSNARLATLESHLEDDDVDERLRQVEAELEEFSEWKRQLRNLFS